MKYKENKQDKGRMFRVTIRETLEKVITVKESELKEATKADADQTVSDWWHQGQIILDANDFNCVEFLASEIEEGGDEV